MGGVRQGYLQNTFPLIQYSLSFSTIIIIVPAVHSQSLGLVMYATYLSVAAIDLNKCKVERREWPFNHHSTEQQGTARRPNSPSADSLSIGYQSYILAKRLLRCNS